MCRTARRFPQERSAASIIELQDIFVQVARLYSGSLGKALLWEAAIEQDSCFLSGIINRYPLDKKEIQGIAQEFLLMIGDRYTTSDFGRFLAKLTSFSVSIKDLVDQHQVTAALITGIANPLYARTLTSEHKFNYPSDNAPRSRFLSTLKVFNPLIGVYRKAMALKGYELLHEQALIEAFPKVNEEAIIADILSKLTFPENRQWLIYNRGLFSGDEDVANLAFYPSVADAVEASTSLRALLWLLAPQYQQTVVDWTYGSPSSGIETCRCG